MKNSLLKSQWFAFSLLLIAIIVIYFPVYDFQFLVWDDNYNIFDNGTLQEDSIWTFWKEPYMGMYIPLIYSVWSAIFHIVGADPMTYHIFNVVLHLANSFLVFKLVQKVLVRFYPAVDKNIIYPLCGALLFAVHPLQIGTVAWVSGGRDLLSVFFALLSIIFYFDCQSKKKYFLSLLFFTLALLSKPAIVSLPLVFVLFDWIFKRKIYSTAPFFALGLVFVSLTRSAQSKFMEGMLHPDWVFRPIIALDAMGFYVSKFFFPVNLAVDYGRQPERVISERLFWPYLFLALTVIVIGFLLLKKKPILWVGFGIIASLLLPVLGFVPFNFQRISTVTDHYMYLPMAGIAIVSSFLLFKINSWKSYIPFAVFLIFLVIQSVFRLPVWNNTTVFMEDMMIKNPQSYSAFVILGDKLFNQGKVAEAEELFKKAWASNHMSGLAVGNLAVTWVAKKSYQDVITQLKEYIDNPDFDSQNASQPQTVAMLYLSYAASLARTGNDLESYKRYCQVLKYQPRENDKLQATMALEILKNRIPDPQQQSELKCPYLP